MQIQQIPDVLRCRFYFDDEMLVHDPPTCRVASFYAWKQSICDGDFDVHFRLWRSDSAFDFISFA